MTLRPKLMLEIPENVATQLCSSDHLPSIDDEDAAVQLAEAVSEVTQALIESGRPTRYLHTFKLSIARIEAQRGYRDGYRTACEVWMALLRDAPRRGRPRT